MRDTNKPGKPRTRKKTEKGSSRTFIASAEELTSRSIDNFKNSDLHINKESESDSEEATDPNEPSFVREAGHKPLFSLSTSEPPRMTKKVSFGIQSIVQIENPNLKPKENKVMKAKDMKQEVAQSLSRREREALEKERASAAYLKKHLAGETVEAKRDLARLAEVRKRRETAGIKRLQMEEQVVKQVEDLEIESSKQMEILDSRAIKALKPGVLKDKLKERGLSTQGQKKDLVQRLMDYENERSL